MHGYDHCHHYHHFIVILIVMVSVIVTTLYFSFTTLPTNSPYNFFRTSGDIRPNWGSVMGNLQTVVKWQPWNDTVKTGMFFIFEIVRDQIFFVYDNNAIGIFHL